MAEGGIPAGCTRRLKGRCVFGNVVEAPRPRHSTTAMIGQHVSYRTLRGTGLVLEHSSSWCLFIAS
jgi:hypothetical protein